MRGTATAVMRTMPKKTTALNQAPISLLYCAAVQKKEIVWEKEEGTARLVGATALDGIAAMERWGGAG